MKKNPHFLPVILLALSVPAFAHAPSDVTNGFGKQLLETLDYIDYPDVLVAIAVGNANVAKRYDDNVNGQGCGDNEYGIKTCLLDRWTAATTQPMPTSGIDQELLGIVGKLTDGVFNGFRDFPIDTAGGDFDEDSHGHGYDQLTPTQFAALKANPLLVVESEPGPNGSIYAKYRYPSIGTYNLANFKQYLSDDLVSALDAASANGDLSYDINADFDFTNKGQLTATARSLNQRIVQELLLNYAYQPGDTAAHNYQRLISTHPFDDYNGRSTRAWYKRHNGGRPLFLMDFYCDTYCTAADFDAKVASWDPRYDRIVDALVSEEKANPSFPNFYQIPIWWEVAGGYANAPANAGAFVWDAKGWFAQTGNAQRVDHKEYTAVAADYIAYIKTVFPGLVPSN